MHIFSLFALNAQSSRFPVINNCLGSLIICYLLIDALWLHFKQAIRHLLYVVKWMFLYYLKLFYLFIVKLEVLRMAIDFLDEDYLLALQLFLIGVFFTLHYSDYFSLWLLLLTHVGLCLFGSSQSHEDRGILLWINLPFI